MSMLGGEVDLFGLDEFGNNPGMSAVFGIAAGGGSAIVGKYLFSKVAPTVDPQLAGTITGGATAALMYFLGKPSRAAGVAAGATVAVTQLLPYLFNKIMGTSLSGMGLPQVEYLNGAMGLPQVEYLNGSLGMPGIAPVPPSYGTIPGVYGHGIAGPQLSAAMPPVDLLGEKTARAEQVELMGGPTLSGLASAYGATLLGR